MSEKDINIEYICNKTLLDKDDELVPIILEMIQDSYRAGLSQSEYDNTMGLIEHNQMLKDQIRKYQEVIDKVVKYIDDLRDESAERQEFYNCFPDDLYIPDINELLGILKDKEV